MQHKLNWRADAWSKVEDQVDLMKTSMSQQICRLRGLEEVVGATTPTSVEPLGVHSGHTVSRLTHLANTRVPHVKLFSGTV